MSKAIFNGKIIEEGEAKISIGDKGYFFDFVVYSSLKIINGKIFFPEYHVKRLFESAQLIGLEHKFKLGEVIEWLKNLVKVGGLDNSLLRIVLIGDPDNKGDEKLYIFLVGGLTFYPDKFYKKGVKVITYQGERRFPQAKTKDLLMSFIAYRMAKEQNALDALLVDHWGNILEGTRTNFFAIKCQTIITPPARQVLGGITRNIILEAVKKDFVVKEESVSLKDVKDYDEIFISSTSMNVMPIRQINDMIFETNFIKTRLIEKLLKVYCSKNF